MAETMVAATVVAFAARIPGMLMPPGELIDNGERCLVVKAVYFQR
jgi:hypothetical protein